MLAAAAALVGAKKAANCQPEDLSQWRTQQAEGQGAGNQEDKQYGAGGRRFDCAQQ